jgi:hypothetical protein
MSTLDIDFELCCKVCHHLTRFYGEKTPASQYPSAERTVVLVWTAAGIIENGGFRYFFSSVLPGDPDYSLTIKAFSDIGARNAADVIRRAICLFPDCIPRSSATERVECFDNQPEMLKSGLDIEFSGELDNVTISLASYIRKNRLDELRKF